MENGMRRWLVNISDWNPSEEHFATLVSIFPEDRQQAITRVIMGLSFPRFNFNVSHHGDYVGIASEPVCLVGLDIVSITIPEGKKVIDFIKNFSSYFTAFEWKNILDASTSNKILTEFYRYWVLKEAFVKAIGTGIGYGLHRLEFHHTEWSNIFVAIDGIRSRRWKFELINLDDKHLASLARGFAQEADDSLQPNPGQTYQEESLDVLSSANSNFILRTVGDLFSKTL